MAIRVEFMLSDESPVGGAWLREAPQIGSIAWLSDRKRLVETFGTSSFRVTEVAHWINENWSPQTHVGDPIHTICAFVEPILP